MSSEAEVKAGPSEGAWMFDKHGEIVDPSGRMIADLSDSDFSQDQDVANGHLMAASKDLLEACEAAAEEVEHFRDTLTDVAEWAEAEAVLVQIKCAVAKARTGVSP